MIVPGFKVVPWEQKLTIFGTENIRSLDERDRLGLELLSQKAKIIETQCGRIYT